MRQRTKVGKPLYYVELVGEESGAQIARWPSVSGVSRERAVDQASAWRTGLHPESDPKVVRIVKVTTVRLAPLVVLPAWEPNDEGPFCGCKQLGSGWWIRATVFKTDGAVNPWTYGIAPDKGDDIDGSYHESADEARAACEKRLRELGYRVARKAGEK